MSAIGGLVRFDGRPVERADLERMANALRMYGPDRIDIAVAPRIGLLHALMRMTPEDRFDRQPWRGASGAVIVADLRIDNRDDVLARLDMRPHDALAWPDSRVVLAAWERFGNALWPTLHGPFAVAIWNPADASLTLARDQLGLNVVMWHRARDVLAFATMPKGLFALPEVPRELNHEKLGDFLVLNHADHATTFFRDIHRLPPAHVATVGPDGSMVQHRYWSPADLPRVRLGSDAAYAEGLRAVLDGAVRRQMRSAHPIGCHLSGGLDSSAVAALTARALAEKGQRLAAFTQVPRDGFAGEAPAGRYNDETPYVEAIRAMAGNIDVTYVRNHECDDFDELERMFLVLEAPVRNPSNLGWMMAIGRRARAQGRRVLLGGQMGNYTISWFGWSQVLDHVLGGRWITASRQWHQFYRHTAHSRWTALRRLLLEPLAPERLIDWVDRRRRPHRRSAWEDYAAARREFAAGIDVDARARRLGHDFHHRMRRGERARGLTAVDYLGDWQAAEKALLGVEVRDPTADMEVVAYCFGVPPEQFLAEDIDRSLIRRAMWGLLPELVLTNRLIGYQAADWHEKLAGRRRELAGEIAAMAASPIVRTAIDIERMQQSVRDWPSGGWHTPDVVDRYQNMLMRGVAVGRFLRWIDAANLGGRTDACRVESPTEPQ